MLDGIRILDFGLRQLWRTAPSQAWRLLGVLMLRFRTLSADPIETMLRRVNFDPLSRPYVAKLKIFARDHGAAGAIS